MISAPPLVLSNEATTILTEGGKGAISNAFGQGFSSIDEFGSQAQIAAGGGDENVQITDMIAAANEPGNQVSQGSWMPRSTCLTGQGPCHEFSNAEHSMDGEPSTENIAEILYWIGTTGTYSQLSTATVGSNGKFYPFGWGGGSRGRIATMRIAELGDLAGKGVFLLGVSLDAVGVGVFFFDDNSDLATTPEKAGTNLGFAILGFYNPAAATMYFGVDLFVPGGWQKVMQVNDTLIRQNQKVLGDNWQLHGRGPGN